MKSRNPKAEESEQACLARTKAGADAEAAYEEHRMELVPTFDAPLISDPRNPPALASHLSKQFPTLRVAVIYEDGHPVVTALLRVYKVDTRPYYSDIENIRAAVTAEKIENHWPSFVEVRAYAQGYDKASASADELRELREENKRLKNEDYRDAHRFLGFHRMNFG